MNAKHRKTLVDLYAQPAKRNITWSRMTSLIETLNGHIIQGSGSRVRIVLGDQSLNIHTPHPGKELKPYQVHAVRTLLKEQGVKP
jgi:hypothetical protein